MIIGLGHKKQVGKSTAARILVEEHGFIELSFAARLKALVYAYDEDYRHWVDKYGLEEAKTIPAVRKKLQLMGDVARQIIDSHVWIRPVIEEAVKAQAQGLDVVISDVRYLNEVEAIRKVGGHFVDVVRLDLEPDEDQHPSEVELDGVDPDWTLYNPGNSRRYYEDNIILVLGAIRSIEGLRADG